MPSRRCITRSINIFLLWQGTIKQLNCQSLTKRLKLRIVTCSPKVSLEIFKTPIANRKSTITTKFEIRKDKQHMTAKTLTRGQMTVIGSGDWMELFRLPTAGNPNAEISARRSGKWLAAKCLTLYVGDAGIKETDDTSLEVFARNIMWAKTPVLVRFLAVDRPTTYFPFPGGIELAENWQYEIPGGVVNINENQRLAGLRESLEESGLEPGGKVLQTTTLLPFPFATDSGSQVEMYCYEAALLQGEPKTIAKEGIHTDKCAMVQLPDALDFLLNAQSHGILIEGHALTSLLLLERALATCAA